MVNLNSTLHLTLKAFVAFSIAALITIAIAANAGAADPDDACGTATNIIKIECSGTGPESNAIWGILLLVITIMTAGVGLLAIGGLVYGAILYTTAQNNSGQITKAKETIANVILGIVLYAFMWSLLQFLIPGGVFTDTGGPSVRVTTSDIPTPTPPPPPPGNNTPPNDSGVTASDITIKNFRDASAVTNGDVLKPGVLYRSAELARVGDNQLRKLGQLMGANALILDVRTVQQARDHPDKRVPGVPRTHIPMEGFLPTKVMITQPRRYAQFAKVLRKMANQRGAVLIHCSAGKDRTGWTVAMIMGISGASRAQIKREYAKSTEAWPNHNPDWIDSGLTQIDNRYNGSYKRYLKEAIGLTDAEITKLRNKFKA